MEPVINNQVTTSSSSDTAAAVVSSNTTETDKVVSYFKRLLLDEYQCNLRKDQVTGRWWFELSPLLCKFNDQQNVRRRWYKALSAANLIFVHNKITLGRVENLDWILRAIGATDATSSEIMQYKAKYEPDYDALQDYTDCPFSTQQSDAPFAITNLPSKKRQRSPDAAEQQLIEPDIVTVYFFENNLHNPAHYERTMIRRCCTCREFKESIPRPLDCLIVPKNKFQCRQCHDTIIVL